MYSLEPFGRSVALVLESLPGQSLQTLLGRRALNVGECLSVAIKIVRALETLHARRVVHRDIKPGNIPSVGCWPPAVRVPAQCLRTNSLRSATVHRGRKGVYKMQMTCPSAHRVASLVRCGGLRLAAWAQRAGQTGISTARGQQVAARRQIVAGSVVLGSPPTVRDEQQDTQLRALVGRSLSASGFAFSRPFFCAGEICLHVPRPCDTRIPLAMSDPGTGPGRHPT